MKERRRENSAVCSIFSIVTLKYFSVCVVETCQHTDCTVHYTVKTESEVSSLQLNTHLTAMSAVLAQTLSMGLQQLPSVLSIVLEL
jgi:hypothetical protein